MHMNKITAVACPQCKKETTWNHSNCYRPFCSERCKMIDLGQWFSEDYRISHTDSNPEEDPAHQA